MSAVEVLRLAQESGIRLGVSGADLILDAERGRCNGNLSRQGCSARASGAVRALRRLDR